MFVPAGFEPPHGLEADAFRLEPLGPEHNERDYAAWSSSIEHILGSPGYGPESSWPRPLSLEENLGDLERHARDFAERTGFTYTVLDSDDDVIGCVYVLPGARRRPRRPRAVVGARVARRARRFRSGTAVARLAGTRLAVRTAALRAVARLTLRPRATTSTRRENRHRGQRAEQVECEPARAHRVDEREQRRRDEECGDAEQRDERGAPEAVAGLAEPARPLLERPVAELGAEQEACGDRGRGDVERRVVDRELRRIEPSGKSGGERESAAPSRARRPRRARRRRRRRPGRRPPGTSRCRATSARASDGEEARPRCRAPSLGAGQPRVAPVCPHLLEHRVELVVAPGRDADPERDEPRREAPRARAARGGRRASPPPAAGLDERDRIDLDHGDVEAARAEVLERRR